MFTSSLVGQCTVLLAATNFHQELLYGHLTIKDGRLMTKAPTPRIVDPQNKPFWLRLDQYFDKPELLIPVVRFQPECHEDTRKLVFPITNDGSKYVVTADEILSPPLIPYLRQQDLAAYSEKFKTVVYKWLKFADKNDNIQWHNEFFRIEYGKAFPRDLLQVVCEFYHKVMRGGCQALRSALQSTILVYMLGHAFYVPENDIKKVLDKTGLGQHYNGEFMFVSPIYVNRFIKVMLYQFLKATVRLALKCYQDLCSSHKHTKLDRDRILAVSIVLLIVAGSIQSKAIEKAVASRRRNSDVDTSEYYESVKEIEEWIVDLICEVWAYKFRQTGKIKPDDEPAERLLVYEAKKFDLMERIKGIYENHGTFLGRLQHSFKQSSIRSHATCSITNFVQQSDWQAYPQTCQVKENWTGRFSVPRILTESSKNSISVHTTVLTKADRVLEDV